MGKKHGPEEVIGKLPLRANDDETSSPRKITLEGVGETSTWLCPA